MLLPQRDIGYLNDRSASHAIATEGGMTCIVIPHWPLPIGLDHDTTDILLRLSPGYPDVPPDMWWFSPSVRLSNGQALPASDVFEMYLGRRWQRWSRHFREGQWQSGIDGLESYVALIRQDLERSVPEMIR